MKIYLVCEQYESGCEYATFSEEKAERIADLLGNHFVQELVIDDPSIESNVPDGMKPYIVYCDTHTHNGDGKIEYKDTGDIECVASATRSYTLSAERCSITDFVDKSSRTYTHNYGGHITFKTFARDSDHAIEIFKSFNPEAR